MSRHAQNSVFYQTCLSLHLKNYDWEQKEVHYWRSICSHIDAGFGRTIFAFTPAAAALGPRGKAQHCASVIGLAGPQFCTTPFNRGQVCCLMWWNKGSWKESVYGERLGVKRIVYVFGGPVTHPSTNLHTGDGSKPGDWDTRWTSWRRIFDLDLNSPWSLSKQLEVKDNPLTGFF